MDSENASLFSSEEDDLPPARGLPRWIWALGSIPLLLILLLIVMGWLAPPDESQRTFRSGPETRPVALSSEGYIGSQRCQACHQREYQTWHASYHRTMTQIASPAAILGNFSGELEHQGRTYQLGQDGDQRWIEFESPDPDPDSSPSTLRRNVVLCTGSHHMQVYWLSTGKGAELAIMPFVWLIEERRWIPREAAFLKPSSHSDGFEAGRWNRTCIDCHTTHGNPHLAPPAPPQSTVSEFGIACEACHGPGEPHVRHHTLAHSKDGRDPIVQPQHLAQARSAEVCGQCHMAWHAEVVDSALKFRPGGDLMSLRRIDKKPSQFWPDGMVRVVGREFNGLRESPCFQRGTMTCLSCHAMHQAADDARPLEAWRDDQLQPHMRGNEACLSCHAKFRDETALAAHSHHAAGSEGSRCYNCHMPNTAYGLLKASRSHQISNPSVAETVQAGRPNACNLCHLDKSLEWTNETLSDWYGRSPDTLSATARERALSVQFALAGNAGQRALIAWHMGWEPARQASRADWQAPYLAILLLDDYPAVRAIAERSLKQLGGYDDLLRGAEHSLIDRQRVSREITERWEAANALRDQPALLITPDGTLQRQTVRQLLEQRDQTEIVLDE